MAESLRFLFPASHRLKTPAEFRRVYDRKRSVSDHRLVVYACESNHTHMRIGLSVSKKHGNAVARNRYKRLLREAYRLLQHELPTGLDVIFIPRVLPVNPSFAEIQDSLRWLVPQAKRRLGPPGALP